jgi:hypothetical protein
MLMDIIKPTAAPSELGGDWSWQQDPDSGAFVETWIADSEQSGSNIITVKCLAKPTLVGSIRAAEQIGEEYLNEEWVKISLPFNANITLRDKVSNIRTLQGVPVWSEEESDNNPATVFDVFRVSPVVDGFGMVVEKMALVKRGQVQ